MKCHWWKIKDCKNKAKVMVTRVWHNGTTSTFGMCIKHAKENMKRDKDPEFAKGFRNYDHTRYEWPSGKTEKLYHKKVKRKLKLVLRRK